MKALSDRAVRDEIDRIVAYLVEVGLAGDQNFALMRTGPGQSVEITFPRADHISAALKDRPYADTYEALAQARAYNVKLPDGGLLQMSYAFADGSLRRHRLAFFPAPHLEEFQNNPEIYLEDQMYADVVARSIVTFPLRFDYDSSDTVFRELLHPKSHLTLGQYDNCRIPVTAPLTPSVFAAFVLRNFYHTAFQHYADKLPTAGGFFEDCIFGAERSVVHIAVPDGTPRSGIVHRMLSRLQSGLPHHAK